MAAATIAKRGLLIVFEGCDRSGKTTICQRLVEELNRKLAKTSDDKDVKTTASHFMRFPDRSTLIGGVINDYLKGDKQLDDHVVHLLFSSNRWEKLEEMNKALSAGTHVIVDRYAFSGVAFSAAKDGMSLEWCKNPDRNLPRPDLVCFLDVSPEEAMKRGGFGQERYEKIDFQAKVRRNYDSLMDERWEVIDTDDKTLDDVYGEVTNLINGKIESHDNSAITLLWPISDKESSSSPPSSQEMSEKSDVGERWIPYAFLRRGSVEPNRN